MGPCSEDGQITVSPHGGPVRSQALCSGQQVLPIFTSISQKQ